MPGLVNIVWRRAIRVGLPRTHSSAIVDTERAMAAEIGGIVAEDLAA